MAKDQINEKYKNSPGMKFDGGKQDWSLVPWEVIDTLVTRLTVGKEKYAAWNWTKVEDAQNRYEAAMFRHFLEYKKGNRWDDDINFKNRPSTHLQAAFWNLMCLVYFELQDIKNESKEKENK